MIECCWGEESHGIQVTPTRTYGTNWFRFPVQKGKLLLVFCLHGMGGEPGNEASLMFSSKKCCEGRPRNDLRRTTVCEISGMQLLVEISIICHCMYQGQR